MAECALCPAGTFCGSPGIRSPSGVCTAGYVCGPGSNISRPPGLAVPSSNYSNGLCPAGYYCPSGSVMAIPCPKGTFNNISGAMSVSACLPCPAGKFCDREGWGSNSFPLCKGGYYCPSPYLSITVEESFLTSSIDVNGFVVFAYESFTSEIAIGHVEEKLDHLLCPVGHRCPRGSAQPLGCCVNRSATSMQYCDSFQKANGSLLCDPCPEGMVCPRLNPLDGVAFSFTTDVCPEHYFCENGSLPTSCRDGLYGSSKGLTNALQCTKCPGGMWCTGGEIKGHCSPGYICSSTSVSATPVICTILNCTPRSDSNSEALILQGNSSCPHPENSKNQSLQMLNVTSNYSATGGWNLSTDIGRTPFGNQTSKNSSCHGISDNSSCVDPFSLSSLWNISNWYNLSKNLSNLGAPLGLSDSTCNGLCPEGSYCPEGTAFPILCPAGTYLSNSSSTYPGSNICDCLMCPPGYFCMSGTSIPSPCPRGHYCPSSIKVDERNPCSANRSCGQYPIIEVCPPGTFQPLEKQSLAESCIVCGTWIGNVSYLGRFCPNAGSFEQTVCPAGQFCVSGSYLTFPCMGGTYRQAEGGYGNLSCYVCPASYFCPNGTIHPQPCPRGRFCKPGSAYATICPGGFFCPASTSVPYPCPPGAYCSIGSWAPSACPVGTYCVGKVTIPTLCPLGTYGNFSAYLNRSSISEACIDCPKGFFGNDPLRLSCEICYAGYLCYGNSSVHTHGTTRGDPQDISVDGGQICPAGYFCQSGSFLPSPCPRGSFNAVQGSVDSAACVQCPLNYFNNRTGQPACEPCGSTSYSTSDRIECKCKGGNRVFQQSDSACRCAFGYAIYDSTGNPTKDGFSDGIADCEVRTLPRCSPGDVRGQDGSCVQSCADAACESPPCFCRAGTGVDYCNGTCPSFQIPQAQKIQVCCYDSFRLCTENSFILSFVDDLMKLAMKLVLSAGD